MNVGGRLITKTSPQTGLLYYYLDPHVTNCCNAYFCPAGTGRGYPKYACKPGPEIGYQNLALFFYGCGLNCLFCQNWNHKIISQSPVVTAQELVDVTMANSSISCWYWFGGSPEPQLPFAVNASKFKECKPSNRIVRNCENLLRMERGRQPSPSQKSYGSSCPKRRQRQIRPQSI